jgi:hypothetical protein
MTCASTSSSSPEITAPLVISLIFMILFPASVAQREVLLDALLGL